MYLDGYNPRRVATTDTNGNYSFTGLLRGDYTMSVSHPSFEFNVNGYSPSHSLTVGSPSSGPLFYGKRIQSSIFGAIRSANGSGLSGVTLTIASLTATNTLTADADGLFSLTALPGNYTITIAPTAFYAFSPATSTVTVTNGGDGIVNFTYVPMVARVSPFGHDSNDGNSWSTPKYTIGAALAAVPVGGEVWVAAGTYYERINMTDRSVYGGFVGIETAREQRTFSSGSTINADPIILGNIGLTPGNVVMIYNYTTNTIHLEGMGISYGLATSPSHGGGIHIENSSGETNASPVIANCFIYGNTASYGGGGIYIGASSYAVITNNTIQNNTAERGGGIYCDFGSHPLLIANNIIAGNTAQDEGGGVEIAGNVTLFANNTIVANAVTNSGAIGGGLYCGFGSSTNLNNIIAFNTGGGGVYVGEFFNGQFDYNCVYANTSSNYAGLSPGTHDVSTNPLFVDFTNGDYHLTLGSPCIDAGKDSVVYAGAVDLDGQPRIQGIHVDIGADEVALAPILAATHLGNSVIISWSPSMTGWTLQTNGNLGSTNWVNYSGPISNNSVTNPATAGNLFFRLKR